MPNILNRVIKYSIYALVFLLPLFFLPFSFEVFEYSKQYLLFFLVSLAFFSWLLKQIVYDKEIRFRKSPIDYWVLGFLLISLISAIFSVDKSSSIFGFYGRFSNGLIGLLILGAFYFLITNNVAVEDEKKVKNTIQGSKLIDLFLWSISAVVLMGYFSIFGLWAKISSFLPLPQVMLQKTFNPAAGSLEGLAIFLAVIAVLLVGLLLSKNRIFYWILLSAALGLLAVIDFTPAWIVLLATLVVLLAVSLTKRIFKEDVNRLLVPIFLIIISAAFIIWQPIKMDFPKEQILSQPISWEVALKSASDNVKNGFTGSGFGTFQYDFSKYKPQSFNQNWMWQIRFDRAGSYFAELLGTIGFLGLLVYIGIVAMFLFISRFLISKDFLGLHLIMTFTALVVGQLVYYQNTSLGFVFWLILGLSVVSWRIKSPALMRENKISFKNFPELSLLLVTAVIILGAAISALYFYGAKYYLADINYSNALASAGDSRVKNIERAVSLNPGLTSYRTALARTYLVEALNELQKPQAERDPAKIQLLVARAIEQGGAATALQPNQVANWETSGVIYREIGGIAAGATEWGLKSIQRAIDLEPSNPALYTELGRMYFTAGDKEKAMDNLNKALEKKSDYAAATIQLALLLEQDNILDEAVIKLENLIKDDSYNIEARFQLGRLYFNNKMADKAIEQFRVVTVLVPNHSNAHYSLGIAYASQGKTELAIQEFEKVLELNPGNQDIIKKLKELE